MDHYKTTPSHKIDTTDFFSYYLANSDSVAIFILDKKGIVVDINLGVSSAYGYSKEDIVGKYFSSLFIEEDRHKHLPEMEILTVLEKGFAKDNNYVLHKNGAHVWSQGESVFVKNKEGEVYIVKSIYDLSNQKMLEDFLIESNKKLKRINKDKDSFIYAASHDLKSPINNLEGLIDALLRQIPDDCKKDKSILHLNELITSSINRFKNVLLDLTKVGVEGEAEDLEEVQLDTVFAELKHDLFGLIESSGAILDEDLSRANKIFFSRKNVRSILYNLVSNAIKYRSPDRTPKVLIKAEPIEDYILLSVEDNGSGIAAKDIDKVFLLGKRLDEKVEGSGIGMALVKRIIDNSDGKIEVESEVGKGSTFKVYFKNYLPYDKSRDQED